MDQETSKADEGTQLLEKLQRDFEEHRKKNPSQGYRVRVLEVRKAIKESVPRDKQPWQSYRTIEEANESFKDFKKKRSLGVMLGRELGFEFVRRTSKDKTKVGLIRFSGHQPKYEYGVEYGPRNQAA